FPADYRYDNIISVMASDRNDSKPGFSNYGGEKVDVAAPGQHILSASIYRGLPPHGPVLSPETEFNPAYRFYDGTSAAAAFASGAAAMLLSIDDTWKPNEIRDHLIASADECAGLRGLCRANGRLNLRRAVCGPFSVTVPGAEAGFKSGEKITVKWQLEYDSPVVKT